jgi:hypothetical protein
MKDCAHLHSRTIREGGFVGPIYGADENPAAHGGVCVDVECTRCGARRSENRNQGHSEAGPWGPPRAAREARAAELAARARRALAEVSEITLWHPSGRSATLRLDQEGYIVAEGLRDDEVAAAAAAAPEWFRAACAAREAVIAAEAAAREV